MREQVTRGGERQKWGTTDKAQAFDPSQPTDFGVWSSYPLPIQWDSFRHWAVIALVIGKLWGYLLQAKENGCFVWRTWERRQHRAFTHAKMLLVSVNFFPWWVDYALEENVLTEQVWFLPLIWYWEVVTRILIFCSYCLWHDLPSDARAFSLTSLEK